MFWDGILGNPVVLWSPEARRREAGVGRIARCDRMGVLRMVCTRTLKYLVPVEGV